MGWKVRANGKASYYRSRRVGGKVRTEYLPAELGATAASDVLARRARLEHERSLRDAARASWEALQGPLRELINATDTLTKALLLAAGYHQHDRGQWRRRANADGDRSQGEGG